LQFSVVCHAFCSQTLDLNKNSSLRKTAFLFL
jgi:hypothetical protein